MFGSPMFGCGGACSSSSPFGFGKGSPTGATPSPPSNLPKALQIAANRAKMAAAPLLAAPASGGSAPSLSEVDMDSMASMMNMATMALAAGNSNLPKIPMPLPVGKAPAKPTVLASPAGFVPPGRVDRRPEETEPVSKDGLPTSTTVKVTDDEGKLSLDEMVKRVGEKVNKAGGLTAIGYGAAKGKPYVRGRPQANSVISDDYREGPYSRGKGKGDSQDGRHVMCDSQLSSSLIIISGKSWKTMEHVGHVVSDMYCIFTHPSLDLEGLDLQSKK